MPGHTGGEDPGLALAGNIGGALGMILFGKRLKEKELSNNPAFLDWLQPHYREAAFADEREGSDQYVKKLADANGVGTDWLHENVGILVPSSKTLHDEFERRSGIIEERLKVEQGELALTGQYSDAAFESRVGEITAEDESTGGQARIAENISRLKYFEVANEGDLSGLQAKRDLLVADLGLKTASAVIDLYDSLPPGEKRNAFAYSTEVPRFQAYLEGLESKSMQERMHALSLLPQPGEIEEYRLKTSITLREIINDATDRLSSASQEFEKDSLEYKEALADYDSTQQLQGQMVAGGFAYPKDYSQANIRERPLARDKLETISRPYESTMGKAFMSDLVDGGIFSSQYDGVRTLEEFLELEPEAAAEFANLANLQNGVFVQEELRKNFSTFVETGRDIAIEANPEVMGSIEGLEALLSGTSEPAKNPSFIYGEFVNSLSEPFQALLGFSGVENQILKQLEAGNVPDSVMEIVRETLQAQPDATRFLGPPGMQR